MNKTHLIIHHSAVNDNLTLSDFDAIRNYHTSYAIDGIIVTESEFFRRKEINSGRDFKFPWKDIGYFVVIEYQDNKLVWIQGRGLKEDEAHCYQNDMNKLSLGICVVGNFDIQEPALEVINFLADFVSSLLVDIPSLAYERIKKHSDYASKTCPGIKFPWGLFLEKAKQGYYCKIFIKFLLSLIGKKKVFVLDKIRE